MIRKKKSSSQKSVDWLHCNASGIILTSPRSQDHFVFSTMANFYNLNWMLRWVSPVPNIVSVLRRSNVSQCLCQHYSFDFCCNNYYSLLSQLLLHQMAKVITHWLCFALSESSQYPAVPAKKKKSNPLITEYFWRFGCFIQVLKQEKSSKKSN